jgi:hypothetical protein
MRLASARSDVAAASTDSLERIPHAFSAPWFGRFWRPATKKALVTSTKLKMEMIS